MDHISIRLWTTTNRLKITVDEFRSFYNFIINCHNRIEEEKLFTLWVYKLDDDAKRKFSVKAIEIVSDYRYKRYTFVNL